jgi:polysaccharide pyruvyl transferase WcaK-like protein
MIATIGVFGHVGNENQGDEALFAAAVQNMQVRCPGATVVSFTLNPEETARRHGIPCFPIRRSAVKRRSIRTPSPGPTSRMHVDRDTVGRRVKRITSRVPSLDALLRHLRAAMIRLRGALLLLAGLLLEVSFLLRSYRRLRSIDLLIVAGSQQCNDLADGPWNFPLALFTWSVLSRLAGTKVVFLSVGAGPPTARSSRFLIRQALGLAAFRSFRDEPSRQLVRTLGVRGDLHLFPDLVYSLTLQTAPPPPRPMPSQPNTCLTVRINPLPLYSPYYWMGHNAAAHVRYIDILATFAAWLLRRGHTVVLFPTQLRVDPPVIDELRLAGKRLAEPGTDERLRVPMVQSFDALIATLGELDLAVATRFHGVVFSHCLEKPVLGIAYHTKTREVMAATGNAEDVISVEDLDTKWLTRRFLSMVSRLPALREDIRRHTAMMRRLLEGQYDRVLALVHTETVVERRGHANPADGTRRLG